MAVALPLAEREEERVTLGEGEEERVGEAVEGAEEPAGQL